MIAEEPLNIICCPRCKKEHEAKEMKLKIKVGFSNLTCKACREITTAASWRCKCNLLWIKCGLHKHETKQRISKGKTHEAEKMRQMRLSKGVVKPMPKMRVAIQMHEVACIGMQQLVPEQKRLRLDPTKHSRLAAKFKKWVWQPEQTNSKASSMDTAT